METMIFGNLKATPPPLWTWPSKKLNETHQNYRAWGPDLDAWYWSYWGGTTIERVDLYIKDFCDGSITFDGERTRSSGYGPSRFIMLNAGTYKFNITASSGTIQVYSVKFIRSGDEWIYGGTQGTNVGLNAFTLDETSLYMFEFRNNATGQGDVTWTNVSLGKVS